MTVHEVETASPMPMHYLVTPDRVGRHKEVEPFEAHLGNSPFAPADELARLIQKQVKPLLVSSEFTVWVDMEKGIFKIDGGRFGKGTFTPIAGGVRIG